MARKKVDLIIEAVKYLPSGEVDWVRGFERRGSAYSDWILLPRQAVVDRIKMGKKVFTGRRIPYLAGTFEVHDLVKYERKEGKELLHSGNEAANQDHLDGVPVL